MGLRSKRYLRKVKFSEAQTRFIRFVTSLVLLSIVAYPLDLFFPPNREMLMVFGGMYSFYVLDFALMHFEDMGWLHWLGIIFAYFLGAMLFVGAYGNWDDLRMSFIVGWAFNTYKHGSMWVIQLGRELINKLKL